MVATYLTPTKHHSLQYIHSNHPIQLKSNKFSTFIEPLNRTSSPSHHHLPFHPSSSSHSISVQPTIHTFTSSYSPPTHLFTHPINPQFFVQKSAQCYCPHIFQNVLCLLVSEVLVSASLFNHGRAFT